MPFLFRDNSGNTKGRSTVDQKNAASAVFQCIQTAVIQEKSPCQWWKEEEFLYKHDVKKGSPHFWKEANIKMEDWMEDVIDLTGDDEVEVIDLTGDTDMEVVEVIDLTGDDDNTAFNGERMLSVEELNGIPTFPFLAVYVYTFSHFDKTIYVGITENLVATVHAFLLHSRKSINEDDLKVCALSYPLSTSWDVYEKATQWAEEAVENGAQLVPWIDPTPDDPTAFLNDSDSDMDL